MREAATGVPPTPAPLRPLPPALPVRPFFLGSLDMFYRYQQMEEGSIGGTQGGQASLAPATQQPARQLRQGAAR